MNTRPLGKYSPTVRATLDPVAATKDIHSRHKAEMDRGKPEIQAPPPPIIEDTEARMQDEADRLRRRRGRAASILSSQSAPPPTAAKTLLGG